MNEQEFRAKLNPEQYRVMREKGTENAYGGKYFDHKEKGIYSCTACGNILFFSFHKFDSKNGWPSFRKPASLQTVLFSKEASGQSEVLCKKCQSHLGYVINDNHIRTNSVCLNFQAFPEIDFGDKEKEEGKKEGEQSAPKSPASSTVKTITFTLGGLTLGVAAGVAGASYITPPTTCVLPLAQAEQQETSSAPTVSTPAPASGAGTGTEPASTGTAGPATGGTSMPAPSSPVSTTPATSATSSATGTPGAR